MMEQYPRYLTDLPRAPQAEPKVSNSNVPYRKKEDVPNGVQMLPIATKTIPIDVNDSQSQTTLHLRQKRLARETNLLFNDIESQETLLSPTRSEPIVNHVKLPSIVPPLLTTSKYAAVPVA